MKKKARIRPPDWKPDQRAVARHYVDNVRCHAAAELATFRQEQTLESAVARAANALRSDGRKHKHQHRVKREVMQAAARSLTLASQLCLIEAANDFATLFSMVSRVAVANGRRGLGALWRYDTALRIGAKRGLLSTRVYLHCGTRDGAIALGVPGAKNRESIDVAELPEALRELEPYELEDALCLYSGYLDGMRELDDIRCCWPERPC